MNTKHNIEDQRYIRAKKRVKQITGFYWHLFWYLVVNITLLIITYSNLGIGEYLKVSNFSTAFFWGIGLLAHWVSVFGSGIFFSKNWEDRKIKEFMDRDRM